MRYKPRAQVFEGVSGTVRRYSDVLRPGVLADVPLNYFS